MSILSKSFNHIQTYVQQRFQQIKSQMPRRESARRKHPLARECDIIETVHMRLTLLHMTFSKHIDRGHCCFFAGEVSVIILQEKNLKILIICCKIVAFNRAF